MAASPTMSGSISTGSIRRSSRPKRGGAASSTGCTASWCRAALASAAPRARSRPRASRASASALFRHLLWHADGGHRGGAPSRRPARRRLDRIRPVRAPGRRADDRMDARQYRRAAQRERRSRRHDAARRLSTAMLDAGKPGRRDLRRRPDQRAPPPPLRGQYRLQANAGSAPGCGFPACRPTACCRRSSSSPTIPGSSACSSTRSSSRKPFEPHPLFTSFIRAALDQSRLV